MPYIKKKNLAQLHCPPHIQARGEGRVQIGGRGRGLQACSTVTFLYGNWEEYCHAICSPVRYREHQM